VSSSLTHRLRDLHPTLDRTSQHIGLDREKHDEPIAISW
jgi:hypothetical protein